MSDVRIDIGWRQVRDIEEVCRSLIYHGRHFAASRDDVVIQKSTDRLKEIFKDDDNRK